MQSATEAWDVTLSEPLVYRVGTALVVESTPIGNLETSVDQMREERLSMFIRSDPLTVHHR